ncbi:hypothetical protein [Oceanithermus sp.]
MFKRWVWIFAALLLLSLTPVLARDGGKVIEPETPKTAPVKNNNNTDKQHEEKKNKEHQNQERQGGAKGEHEQPGAMEYDSSYSFYGSVRWSDGHVVAGSRRLSGDSPWLAYLAPGMRLEVHGEVEGGVIDASQVLVLYPRSWSFYEGPANLVGLPGEWVKVWFDGGSKPFSSMAVDKQTDGQVSLLACHRSDRWEALPPGLDPEIDPPHDGWWLLEGVVRGGEIYWRLAGNLPGNCND